MIYSVTKLERNLKFKCKRHLIKEKDVDTLEIVAKLATNPHDFHVNHKSLQMPFF